MGTLIKAYKRDKRSPAPTFEHTSKLMSAIKGKNTKPEILLRKLLFSSKIKGYRLHPKQLPGKPDLVFTKHKLAIFVNGCFWHRCPKCQMHTPKHNAIYWQNKFMKTVVRDKVKQDQLLVQGWNVLVIWECDLNSNLELVLERIRKSIS